MPRSAPRGATLLRRRTGAGRTGRRSRRATRLRVVAGGVTIGATGTPARSASRASTTPRSTAGCQTATLVPKDSRAAGGLGDRHRGRRRSRPNGDGRSDEAAPERPLLGDRRRGASASSDGDTVLDRVDGERRSTSRHLGRPRRAARRCPTAPTTCRCPRAGRLGQRADDRHDPRHDRHGPGPAASSRDRRHRPGPLDLARTATVRARRHRGRPRPTSPAPSWCASTTPTPPGPLDDPSTPARATSP